MATSWAITRVCARPQCGKTFETSKPQQRFCSLVCGRTYHTRAAERKRFVRRLLDVGAIPDPEDAYELVQTPAVQPKAAVEPVQPPSLPVSCPSCDAPTPAGDYCHACMSIILSGGDDWSAL